MKTHSFTLVLSGVSEITAELANALYEALHGDIEFGMCEGVAYLEVTRKSKTLRDAINSAIEQVHNAGVGVRVIRVESESANTIARINADLLGLSRAI